MEVRNIQNLLVAKNKGILNHFLVLANELSIPFIFVGTKGIMPFLKESQFFIQRRMGAEIPVNRFANDLLWKDFMKNLWEFQWTQEKIPLTEDFCDVFYRESGGVIDRAIELYRHAQKRSIKIGIDTKECFTPEFVRHVSARDYSVSREGLNALVSESAVALRKIPVDLLETTVLPSPCEKKIQLFEERTVPSIDDVKEKTIKSARDVVGETFSTLQIERVVDSLQKEKNILLLDESMLLAEVVKRLFESKDVSSDRKVKRKKTVATGKQIITKESLPLFQGIGDTYGN